MTDLPTIKWPWPKLLLSGYQSEFQTGHLEIPPDAGIPFRREKFSDIGEIVQGTILLSLNDARLFWDWYKNTIRQGALNFLYYDCVDNIERVARILEKPLSATNSNKQQINIKMYFMPQEIPIEEYLVINPNFGMLINPDRRIYQNGSIFL